MDTAEKTIASFLIDNGLPRDSSLQRLFGGANNKVFRVITDKGSFLLKAYFKHPNDSRDRLRSEFSFCKFAWERGIRSLPQPVACDYQSQLALYEFIEGKHLRTEEITSVFLQCALNFYQQLNNYKRDKDAEKLALASEACFSIESHLLCVETRLEKLKNIEGKSKINLEALDFINRDLLAAWEKVRDAIINKTEICGVALNEEISTEDKCLSPSDFGFHNVILTDSGDLRFIDFEYAGWDDPAKMVCDFFCQPKIAVSFDYLNMFVTKMIPGLLQPEKAMWRIAALFPLYQLKWCCILLNDFLPIDSQRRRFALEVKNNDVIKTRQLHKAYKLFENWNRTDFNRLIMSKMPVN